MPSDHDPDADADPSDPSVARSERRDDADGLTEDDVERIVRRVVREELDARDGRDRPRSKGPIWTLIAGVLVGTFLLLPLSGTVTSVLVDAGVPMELLAIGWLLVAVGMVAYGWRLPPFR